jgi:hypothetical protein
VQKSRLLKTGDVQAREEAQLDIARFPQPEVGE